MNYGLLDVILGSLSNKTPHRSIFSRMSWEDTHFENKTVKASETKLMYTRVLKDKDLA